VVGIDHRYFNIKSFVIKEPKIHYLPRKMEADSVRGSISYVIFGNTNFKLEKLRGSIIIDANNP
jgi:hypothetical protein